MSRLAVKIMLSAAKWRVATNRKKKERMKTLTIPNVFDVHSHNERGGARWDEVRWVIWLADVSPVPATTPHTTHVTLRNFKIHSCIEWSVQKNTATATFRMYSKRFSFTFSCCCCCLFIRFLLDLFVSPASVLIFLSIHWQSQNDRIERLGHQAKDSQDKNLEKNTIRNGKMEDRKQSTTQQIKWEWGLR